MITKKKIGADASDGIKKFLMDNLIKNLKNSALSRNLEKKSMPKNLKI